MHDAQTELFQFPYSHYNEKARWALDFKKVQHRRTNVLPGPHAITIKRMTGQNQVPVVRFGDDIVHGSAEIIDELEKRYPDPPLYPRDPELRRKALEIQKHFDEEVGPQARRAMFSVLLQTPGYIVRMFGEGHGRAKILAYRASFPLVAMVMKREMGVEPGVAIEKAFESVDAALNFVADNAGPNGYLAGDSFSVADLTAASLLALTTSPPNSTMHRPEPQPPSVLEWNERWAGHPGVAWVLDCYARNRNA